MGIPRKKPSRMLPKSPVNFFTSPNMSFLKIGAATVNQTPFDWDNNIDHIVQAIRHAKKEGIDLLCFPELTITGYGCEDAFLSPHLAKKALTYLPQIAAETQGIAVAVGLPIWVEGQLFNTACMLHNTEILGFYAKQHLAKDGVHYEPRWFQEWPVNSQKEIILQGKSYPIGDITFPLFHTQIGFEICEDAWRSTRPAPRLLQKGVKIILNPSASHYAMAKTHQRESLFVESSIVYHCTYVYANLLGNEAGRILYDGELLIAQEGRLLHRNRNLSMEKYQVIWAEVSIENPSQSPTRAFEPIPPVEEELTQAAALGLFDYLRKSKSKGFVLSLSGGADSSMCATLVSEMVKRSLKELGLKGMTDALGLKDIPDELAQKSATQQYQCLMSRLLTCVYQSSAFSSEATLASARALAEEIAATFYHWSIAEDVSSHVAKIEKTIGRSLTWEEDDIALQNIQARARSPLAWMLANLEGKLLLTTSNRSEGDVGYATMDGDTSGSLAPIAGLSKVFVLQWLRWAESHLKYSSLSHVNSLAPSAELRPKERAQTDENDLMPYTVLAAIERLAIWERKSPLEVYQAMKSSSLPPSSLKGYITRFFRLWAQNQWKRERLAPSFHLDDWNVDPRSWCRFPILSGGFSDELEDLHKAD
jgi:NAD+ synthase (glutamine-hydrolysing)